jgi:exopolyphosphatase / guanosine-5'-triphosphate,3'-diphosphate pyrophosphatase
MRHAVIDLGSNTFHALVADLDGRELRSVVLDDKEAVRLGAYAFTRRWIDDSAYERGLAALGRLIQRVRATGCERIAIVATSVFREATNGRRFLAEARGTYGVEIELFDGREEARLTWNGVAAELDGDARKLAVLDLGGGSLGCAHGVRHAESVHSLPLGVFRLRWLPAHEMRDLASDVARYAIDEIASFGPDTVALSSGTARALLRVARSLGRVPTGARYLPRHTLAELATLLPALYPATLAELGVAAERHDTIATGAIVLDTLVQAIGVRRVYVARGALREGLLLDRWSDRCVTSSLEQAV